VFSNSKVPPPKGGDAAAEAGDSVAWRCSAQRELRPPKGDSLVWEVTGSAGASPSQAGDSLVWEVFGSAGASPSQAGDSVVWEAIRLSGSFALPSGLHQHAIRNRIERGLSGVAWDFSATNDVCFRFEPFVSPVVLVLEKVFGVSVAGCSPQAGESTAVISTNGVWGFSIEYEYEFSTGVAVAVRLSPCPRTLPCPARRLYGRGIPVNLPTVHVNMRAVFFQHGFATVGSFVVFCDFLHQTGGLGRTFAGQRASEQRNLCFSNIHVLRKPKNSPLAH
jgi:hypothetical protein